MTPTSGPQTVRLRLDEDGRIIIPSAIRKAVGWKKGQNVILWPNRVKSALRPMPGGPGALRNSFPDMSLKA
jgi:bifunctional DNA-binding transcriptional regulator/antitoxin component of YhaV-PrlF toxin-antitoxin module